jgi:hypothetical protein
MCQKSLMKRYTLRAAVHDARVFTGYFWNAAGRIGTGAKVATLAGSHDRSNNQSRLTTTVLGDVLHSNGETE